ncbi:hypothetical protein BY996DRAFT_4418909 [Phakopsora pachyrhizi]|nr:hypothetical protein BY996DRAFT_4418909 [Phakopsora pachyrhizi]
MEGWRTFQKEFRLEEEVKTLRRELDKLRKEKEQLSLSASSSTTSCIKSATPSLEDPKDVVQNILHENLCEDVFGFKLCGAAPEQNFEKSQQPLEEIEENEERLLFQNSNRSVSTLCNDVKKHFNQNHRETKLAGTQTETVSDNNANQEFFLLETMLRNENKELEKKLSLLTIEHDELKAIQKSSLNKSQETPERPQTESGVSSAERDHTSAVQAELSQALDVISKLELEDKQKEVILKESTLENERLFEQLRKADERVKLLEEKSLERKKKIESDKRSISEKSKIFEARISELQALLDSERQAKKEADDELAARNDEYQAQIDLDLKLQKDLATLKTKLEKFEKKIAAERCKTNEKELEVMNIMQERDQLAHLLETQSLQLDNLAATHKQDADTLVAELEEMLLRSEATADELQKNNNKLSQARQLSESKLKEVREDISESKIKFDAMDDRQRTLVIENEELIKTVQKLNDDLIQSKSQDFFFADLTEKKIEERTNDAKMNLQRSFEFQLDQLKSKNSEMKTHILTLKNRLVAYEEAPPTRQTAAESMETIVDLQSVIEDQKKTIQLLREEAATAAIRPVNGSKRMLRDCDQSHHYNRYEVERLQNIIDEQEKRLSDAKTDLAKCQAHVRNQAEMIAKLQLNPDLFKKQTFEPRSIGRSSELISSSSFHPSAASNLLLEGSPKPLPVPENFGVEDDDEWRKRKNRRRTIEKDMAKLKDENVVERKRNVLLSSTPSSDSARKPKRVLSGISSRNNRLGRTPLSSDSNKEDFHSHSINFSERSQSSSNFSSQGYYE